MIDPALHPKLDAIADEIIERLKELTNAEREYVFDSIFARYCRTCGWDVVRYGNCDCVPKDW